MHPPFPGSVTEQCHNHVRRLYPSATRIEPVRLQGGCSYTLLVSWPASDNPPDPRAAEGKLILQFRPLDFSANPAVLDAAAKIFGTKGLAPRATVKDWLEVSATGSEMGVRALGKAGKASESSSALQVCEMGFVEGVRCSELLPQGRELSVQEAEKVWGLLEGVAEVFAVAWRDGVGAAGDGRGRRCKGKVGRSLLTRLSKAAVELPTRGLRDRAERVRGAVAAGELDILPVVLTHGDLLPSNIMVHPRTWRLEALIDWAEAEFLPFGVGMYGIDHLLGYLDEPEGRSARFVYYEQASRLRMAFGKFLLQKIPGLESIETREAVSLARDVGILLWHGFAWDDGKIDRVVNPVNDAAELAYLEALIAEECRTSASRL